MLYCTIHVVEDVFLQENAQDNDAALSVALRCFLKIFQDLVCFIILFGFYIEIYGICVSIQLTQAQKWMDKYLYLYTCIKLEVIFRTLSNSSIKPNTQSESLLFRK